MGSSNVPNAADPKRRPARPCSGRGQRGQTLILIFLGTLLVGGAATGGVFGGASVPVLRQHVREVMSDQAQRARADLTLDRMAAEAKRDDEERRQFEKDAFAQLARHDATPADLQPLAERGDALHRRYRDAFLDLRFELRGELTEAQWRAAFAGTAASAP
jgi:hypothetical protein